MTVLLKAVTPARGTAWLSQGLGWISGYVVRGGDVAAARTPSALHAELGLGYPGSPHPAGAAHLDTLRLPGATHLAVAAPGTSDVVPPFRDHSPMSGHGFVESAANVVPYWWIAPSALPAGTELWRTHADGRDKLLARYPHVAAGWESAQPGVTYPRVPPRHPELVGIWAEIAGERLLADVLPDGTVIVCSPVPRDGMEQSARGIWWRRAELGELDDLSVVRVLGTWRGRPVQLVGLERGPSGDRAHVVDLGHDALEAEALGLTKTDAGVYEAVVPVAELAGLSEERRSVVGGRSADGGRPPAEPDPVQAAWQDFEVRLASALTDVTDRAILIISSRKEPARYVQFAGGPDRLDAEAPGVDVVADAAEDVLLAAGWARPDRWQPNWSSPLEHPAPEAARVDLARRCVAALRDAYRVTNPGELGYTAWREPAGGDPGEAALEVSALGLPRS
ncbi:hypothetical protein C8046_11265 [Serinibacter arcticus]|uniref:TY-Chap N-terminal domain-containing protein n=1 Tax=Serinibacter arcticus TaxID=1655435 RepID=A0A2U1ZVW6_9MICO|nr:hypothetical protein [Serinibacter arcticus]PWD51137.1 hypothetical protein C8046_11265 [Serinibacter arcticus]